MKRRLPAVAPETGMLECECFNNLTIVICFPPSLCMHWLHILHKSPYHLLLLSTIVLPFSWMGASYFNFYSKDTLPPSLAKVASCILGQQSCNQIPHIFSGTIPSKKTLTILTN